MKRGLSAKAGRREMEDRILVVDDHRDIADSLIRLLRVLGYEAKAVYDGKSAIQEAAEFEPDMAFIDIGMPGLNGYEVVRQIRQQRAHIHVILVALTGWTRSADIQQAYNSGFDLHIAKPMNVDTLRHLLKLLDPSADLADSPMLQHHRLPSKQPTA
jgi:CheY-like chemotaxis protein